MMEGFERKKIEKKINEEIEGRIDIIEEDVEMKGKERVFEGIEEKSLDLEIMKKKLKEKRERKKKEKMKEEENVMKEGMLEKWVRKEEEIVKKGGGIEIIERKGQIRKIIEEMGGRLGGMKIVEIKKREDEKEIRIVIKGKRGRREGIQIMKEIIINGDEGNGLKEREDEIKKGLRRIFQNS